MCPDIRIVRGHSRFSLRVNANGVAVRLSGAINRWHGPCHPILESLDPEAKENVMKNAMKIETLLLQGLFAACALICLLVMGSMLTAKTTVYVASSHAAPVAVGTSSVD
jgi:hypothetical protein